jgi:hypothetical protein
MRLAEHVAGTVEVDAMLDRMTPEQFDEWAAKDLIEPIGYQSQMLGFIAYLLHVWIASGESELSATDFMPWMDSKSSFNNAAAKQILKATLGA